MKIEAEARSIGNWFVLLDGLEIHNSASIFAKFPGFPFSFVGYSITSSPLVKLGVPFFPQDDEATLLNPYCIQKVSSKQNKKKPNQIENILISWNQLKLFSFAEKCNTVIYYIDYYLNYFPQQIIMGRVTYVVIKFTIRLISTAFSFSWES